MVDSFYIDLRYLHIVGFNFKSTKILIINNFFKIFVEYWFFHKYKLLEIKTQVKCLF